MPRADTLREKIMAELVSRLQSINVANGDIFTPTAVERKGHDLPEAPPCPVVYVYEGEERKSPGMGRMQCEFPVLIIYIAEIHSDQLKTGGKMLENLVRAVGTDFSINDADGVPTSASIWETSNDVVGGDASMPIMYVELIMTIEYYHTIGDLTRSGCSA